MALGVYIVGFGAGTFNHVADIWRSGWLPYRFAPIGLNMFWTALTVLDPLVVVALAAGWRRAGLGLAAAIMVADVGINSYAAHRFGWDFGAALPLQSAFLGFVLGSAAFLWPDRKKPGAPA